MPRGSWGSFLKAIPAAPSPNPPNIEAQASSRGTGCRKEHGPYYSSCSHICFSPSQNLPYNPVTACVSFLCSCNNDRKLSGVKQHTFSILQFWKSGIQNGSHWLNSGVGRAVFLLKAPGEIHLLALFQLPQAWHACLVRGPHLSPKPAMSDHVLLTWHRSGLDSPASLFHV